MIVVPVVIKAVFYSNNAVNDIMIIQDATLIVDNSMHLVSLSHSQTLKLLPLFLAQAEELGWVLSRVLFGADEWRCNWTALGWGDDSLVKS